MITIIIIIIYFWEISELSLLKIVILTLLIVFAEAKSKIIYLSYPF